jgi:hypothetical protein
MAMLHNRWLLKNLNRVSKKQKTKIMKQLKSVVLLVSLICAGLCASSQVSLNITKPLSPEDEQMVQKILSQFDPKSYAIEVGTEKGTLTSGDPRGLKDVVQGETIRPKEGDAARTNTKINIFREAAAKTNTTINIFVAATNTKINIFRPVEYDEKHLDLLDKLYAVLSKYEEK